MIFLKFNYVNKIIFLKKMEEENQINTNIFNYFNKNYEIGRIEKREKNRLIKHKLKQKNNKLEKIKIDKNKFFIEEFISLLVFFAHTKHALKHNFH